MFSPFAKEGEPGAMEKMIANMLGFTPAQMHETLTGFRDMIVSTKASMDRIERKLDAIMEAQNVGWNDGGNAGGRGGEPADGDSGVAGNDGNRDAA